MIPIVTPEQMRAFEQDAVAAGVSSAELMERAGRAAAAWLVGHMQPAEGDERPVVGLVGPGNNGGDALVMLAALTEAGVPTAALLVGRAELGELPISAQSLARIRILEQERALTDARVIVDGIYGTGGRAELSQRERAVIAAAEGARRARAIPLVALDVPSGIDPLSGAAAEGAFGADATLVFEMPKIGTLLQPAADYVGELVVLPIGITANSDFSGPRMIDGEYVRSNLPRRGAFAHKSSVGAVLIVGGAPNYYGAPRLAAESALRVGAGLVALAVPRSLVATIAGQLPEAVYQPLNEADARRAAEDIRKTLGEGRYRAAVIGPGLGRDDAASDLLAELFGRARRRRSPVGFGIPDALSDASGPNGAPLSGVDAAVLDADALNWLAEQDNWPHLLEGMTAVLTPHVGELARLRATEPEAIVRDPFGMAAACAREWRQTIVLKCGYSCVATPTGETFVSPRAPRELATAGTGDVLAGLVGGLLAQGMAADVAAASALYIGCQAGALAAGRYGTLSVTARDVIQAVPDAISGLTLPRW